jgi:hypothetical protein
MNRIAVKKNAVFWVSKPCSSEKAQLSEEHTASICNVEEYTKQEKVKKTTCEILGLIWASLSLKGRPRHRLGG